jgi:hypothetical protein
MRSTSLTVLAVAFGALVAIRVAQLHAGLLYPDGYQYLLMARGIATHGRPVLGLGPGGDLFVPNADASLKPMFPALVALLHLFGVGWLDAARAIAAVAGAATVVLCGVVVRRLTGSLQAGIVAGAICLASPAFAYWGGFAGPDTLAPALALAATLALLDRRSLLGGVLVAACVATRPEYVALALAAVPAAALDARGRPPLVRAATSATLTLALLLAVVRPPLALPDARILTLGGLATTLLGALLALARRDSLNPLIWAVAAVVAAGFVVLGRVPAGLTDLLRSDWPLVVAAALGYASVLRSALRPAAVSIALGTALLAAIYFAKNPELERYLAQLVPPLAVLAGLGAARPRSLALFAPAIAALVVLAPTRHEPGTDAFAATRPALSRTTGPVLTAAPDAYGFLLYPRTVRALRPGDRGLIVLDAAQRVFEPELGARGSVVARVATADGLLRPDGRLDIAPTVLVRGEVVGRRG